MLGRTKSQRGSVILEAVIVMPLVLISVLAAGQFAHINLVKNLGTVAAYKGCRAAIRSANVEDVVNKTLLPKIILNNHVTVSKSEHSVDGYYHFAIEYDFPLIFPVVNYVISGIMGYNDQKFYVDKSKETLPFIKLDSSIYPKITLRANSVLPMPYTLSEEEVQ